MPTSTSEATSSQVVGAIIASASRAGKSSPATVLTCRLPNRLVSHPESGIAATQPSPPASRAAPSCAEFSPSWWRAVRNMRHPGPDGRPIDKEERCHAEARSADLFGRWPGTTFEGICLRRRWLASHIARKHAMRLRSCRCVAIVGQSRFLSRLFDTAKQARSWSERVLGAPGPMRPAARLKGI